MRGKRAQPKLPFWKRVGNALAFIGFSIAGWLKSVTLDALDHAIRTFLGFITGFTLGIIVVIASIDLLWPVASVAAKLLVWLIKTFLRLVS